MINIKRILADPVSAEAEFRKRDPNISLTEFLSLVSKQKDLVSEYDSLRSQINSMNQTMAGMDKGSSSFESNRAELREKGNRVSSLGQAISEVEKKISLQMLVLPNFLDSSVPVSQRKEDYVVVRTHGSKPVFDFKIKDHVALGKDLGILDFDRGAKIAAAGFPAYKGKGAILEWALLTYMINHSVSRGFEFMLLPFLNSTPSLTASGNLPRFADEIYSFKNDALHAIPTSEVSITNFLRDETLTVDKLPFRVISYSPCFRREAGSYGKDVKGLMRLHQFNKVESYSFCQPSNSGSELEFLLNNAEGMLEDLGLHFRRTLLPSCDIAQQSSKTQDIEVWLPAAEKYSEVSSASNCKDYQARRANIRFKDGKTKDFVHTLNCSALATPRLMISLLESNQTRDGNVNIPLVLHKYTGFETLA